MITGNSPDKRVLVLFVLRCVLRAYNKGIAPPSKGEFAFAFNHAARLVHIWKDDNFVLDKEDQEVRKAFDAAHQTLFRPRFVPEVGKELYAELREIAHGGIEEARRRTRSKTHYFCGLAFSYLNNNVRETVHLAVSTNAADITVAL